MTDGAIASLINNRGEDSGFGYVAEEGDELHQCPSVNPALAITSSNNLLAYQPNYDDIHDGSNNLGVEFKGHISICTTSSIIISLVVMYFDPN